MNVQTRSNPMEQAKAGNPLCEKGIPCFLPVSYPALSAVICRGYFFIRKPRRAVLKPTAYFPFICLFLISAKLKIASTAPSIPVTLLLIQKS